MSPKRRTLLAALAAGLAGCSTDTVGSPTQTPTEPPDERSPSTPGGSPEPTPTESGTPVAAPQRVELDDERLRWRVDLPRDRVTAPAAGDGRLYVGTGDEQSLDFTDDPAVAGDLTAIGLPDGEIVWHRGLDDPPSAPPRVHEGSVYQAIGRSTGYDGVEQRLVRFDAGGEKRWESSARDAFLQPLAFDGSRAYLGTSDDALAGEGETVFALDLASGEESWAVEGGDCFAGRVIDDTLYVDYAGLAVAALATADGSTRWRRSVEALHGAEEAFPTVGGRLFAAIDRADDYGIAALDATDGETVWTHGLDSSSPFVVRSVTTLGETVVGTEYDGLLFARDAATGGARWEQSFDDRVSTVLAANGTLYVSALDGTVAAIDPETGDGLWRESIAAAPAALRVAAGTLLSIAGTDRRGRITAFDPAAGTVRWRRSVPGRPVGVGDDGGTLAVATDAGAVYGVAI